MVDIMAARNPRSRGNYTVGWICCLPIELAAAQMMFDAIHPPLPQPPNDQNVYVLGSIGRHNIAVAFLRSGGYELRTSADVARDLMNSFPSIQFSLLVGIGGGIPSSDRDIRLGDVVVAQPSAISGGVIQYELDSASSGGRFVQSGILKPPPRFLSTALMWLKETYEVERSRITEFLFTIENKSTGSDAKHFIRPNQEDCLYQADYSHRGPMLDTCVSCDRSKLIPRPPRDAGDLRNPKVHFGQVASFNGELRDGKLRDQLARDSGVCCVEKGAAGLMGEFRCLVIRGISDYADSHKNRRWQRYAAAAAAALAKDLLSMISHHEVPDKRVTRGILPSENLDEMAEELKIRVNDWHGLEFNRFGKLLLHGQMSVGKDRETWQKLECYLFAEMLICVKEKKPSRCSVKASILLKRHLKSMEMDADDYILSLNLSVDELPYFYLRFDSPQQRELWRRTLMYTVEDLSRAQDYKLDHSEVEGNDSRHPALPADNISGRIDPPSSTIPPTDSGYASISHQKFPLNTIPTHEQHQTHSYNDLQSITSDNEGLGLPQEKSGIGEVEIDDNEDIRSIYTFQHGTSLNAQQIYISHLSEDLYNNVRLARYAHETPENIHSVLPRLLKGFALRLGQFGPTQMHRDVMIFIRRYRHDIASNLKLRYLEDGGESPAPANDDDQMELGDIMKLWYNNQDDTANDFEHEQFDTDTGPDASGANDEDLMEDDDYDKGLPEIEAYRQLISNNQAYGWLLGSIQRELNLNPAEPNTQDAIRKRILDFLPTPRTVSRYDQPRLYQTTFTLNWDLVSFVSEQGYDQSKDGFLGRIITITGSSIDAQAMTSLQYLHQAWHSYGADLLQIIETTLLSGPGYECKCSLPDNTQIGAWIDETKLFVEVTGINESIAEIGEQLAWLASALHSSPHDDKLSYCTPFISSTAVENESYPSSEAPIIIKCSCVIDFQLEDEKENVSPPTGQCWHHLFRNAIVVKGFPIPRRSRDGTGLEIPLNVLAGLIQAESADIFKGKLFIKGFSSLLIPTEHMRDHNQIIWHLLYDPDGNRISYLDGMRGQEDIMFSELGTSRHILGWCLDARCYAGTSDANYSIERSWLRRPSPQCRFANTVISAGKPIEGGDEAIYGSKDVPLRIERSNYIEKLSWINKQYVLMWDVGGKRGWLVNGSCALLHLLLASIDFNRTDPLSSAFRLDKASIKGPKKPFTSRSAMEVLLNPDNLSLEIYHAQEGEPGQKPIPPVRIWHRVNLLYSMLEKMMDHQEETLGGSSETLRDMPRGRLEGWDFKDLATHEDPLYPRVCKLASKGKGWVDLSRAVRAITLFGNGFGEIIQSVPTSSSCSRWNRLPEKDSYIAISDYDLANIIDRFGNPNSNPVRLTNQLIWYKADDDLRGCQCTTDPQNTKHSELAQVILPSHFRKKIPKQNRAQLEDRGSGAVVFGYNKDLRWSWSDTGYPVEEDLPSSDDSESDSDDDFHDSGLGTSLAPSAANDGKPEEMPSLRSQPDSLTHEDYEVGIVCALSKELLAVRALFDLSYPDLAKDENDPNCYCLGQIKRFKVVAAGLPHDDYGANSAANVASNLMRTFRRVKFCLLVGIGGGVPSATNDIRLGDIVVGTGVIQVDMGKLISDSQFQRTGGKQTPPAFLGAVITKIKSNCDVSFNSASNPLLDDINLIASRKPEYQYPGAGRDTLFHSEYLHPRGQLNCHGCTVAQPRDDRLYEGPNVFYGLIASGNHVVRDASHRDRLSKEDVICVEMEAAGVVRTTTNCLVIRGICDYSDSHKNKLWQEYAAATAAAYAKFFLSQMLDRGGNASITVPSQLSPLMGSFQLQRQTILHLEKQKRPPPVEEHPPLVIKRVRRN